MLLSMKWLLIVKSFVFLNKLLAMKFSQYFISIAGFVLLVSFSNSDTAISAKRLHRSVLTTDSHLDTPLNLLRKGFDIGQMHEASVSQLDMPKMVKGGLDAAFFAVFTSQKPRTKENTESTYARANQIIDSIYSMADKYKNQVELAFKSSDALDIALRGKKAIYIGMENGFPIGAKLDKVEEFYKRGVRYITLSHTNNNDICDSSTDNDGAEHNGLSAFGKDVVKEMNRLGMMVDVSHISDKAFFDVIELSSSPIIASHSSVRSICQHPRNLSDSMIKVLAQQGGVIQICLLGAYIENEDTTTQNYILKENLKIKYNGFKYKSEEERKQAWAEWFEINKNYPPVLPTIKQAVDHIDYVVNLVGVDYVGIGSDFDGGGGLADCRDVSDFPDITTELFNRGYSKEEIAKIWGGNFLRVFKEVEEVAK